MIHSHAYRRPDPFTARRVLVVGAGQSAAEIAVEVSRVASQTFISVHSGTHVLPRWIGGKPYDARDIDPLNRIPWRLMNLIYSRRVAQELEPAPTSWPMGVNRVLEGIPIVSSDLIPAVRRGHVVVKPAIDRLGHDRVHFVDGSEEVLDRIVYCTGYRISLPFMASSLVSASGRDYSLYPLAGRLLLPPRERMRHVMERPERRTRQRFPGETPSSIRCDPHAYQRLLRADLRRARHFELRASGKSRRRAEEERAEAFFLCERRRSRRTPRAIARAAHTNISSCERREIARRRAEEERVEAFFLCERRRSRRTPTRDCASSSHEHFELRASGKSRADVLRRSEWRRSFLCERRRSRRTPRAIARAAHRTFRAASVGKSRADVLRRSEWRRFSSASDDEVGGLHARLREQLTRTFRAASVGKSRADVLRRSEWRRFSSASDDEVGGLHARLREQLTRNRVPSTRSPRAAARTRTHLSLDQRGVRSPAATH